MICHRDELGAYFLRLLRNEDQDKLRGVESIPTYGRTSCDVSNPLSAIDRRFSTSPPVYCEAYLASRAAVIDSLLIVSALW